MKELFSNRKKFILFLLSICVLLIACVWIINGIINGSIYKSFRKLMSVLAPVFIGFIIAYLCNPIVNFFEKHLFKKIKRVGLKRGLSVFITFLILIFFIYLLLIQFIPDFITAFESLWNTYIVNYKESIKMAVDNINSFIKGIPVLDSLGEIDADKIISWVDEQLKKIQFFKLNSPDGVVNDKSNSIISIFTNENVISTIGYIFSIGTSVIVGTKNFILGLFISIYMLMSKEKCKAHARRLLNAILPPKKVRSVIRFGKLMDHSFGGFIEGKIIDSIIIGIMSYVVFLIFKIPSPYVLAMIVGVTNIIPVFGPFIGAIPCAVFVLLIEPSKTILIIILIIIIQQIDGNLLGPCILGDRINVSSLVVIISIVIMGGLFGIAGMVIGVPVFAVAIQLIQNMVSDKLRKKGMDTDLEQYYIGDADEVIETNDRSSKLIVKTFNFIVNIFRKLWDWIKNLFKKKK